jgi:hypothetical protein
MDALIAVKQFHHKAGNSGEGFPSRSDQCTALVVGLRPSLLLVLHFLPHIVRVLGRYRSFLPREELQECCVALSVSRSGYYQWLGAEQSARAEANAELCSGRISSADAALQTTGVVAAPNMRSLFPGDRSNQSHGGRA